MDESSALLLERARSGDRHALGQLLERHQAQVYRFGIRMCRDPEDAKDVLQDTLIAMARGVRGFRGTSSVSTWLYSIARSYCIKHRRKNPPSERHASDSTGVIEEDNVADSSRAPDEALAGKEVERALERAVASLEPSNREILVLRDMEGLSAQEVATVLNLSVQAVKSRLHRARLTVRAQVAPLLGVPGVEGVASGCPDVVGLFSQYLEDEITSDVCARMQLHLEACDHCRRKCDSLKETLSLCRNSASAREVPLSVQRSLKSALHEFLAIGEFRCE